MDEDSLGFAANYETTSTPPDTPGPNPCVDLSVESSSSRRDEYTQVKKQPNVDQVDPACKGNDALETKAGLPVPDPVDNGHDSDDDVPEISIADCTNNTNSNEDLKSCTPFPAFEHPVGSGKATTAHLQGGSDTYTPDDHNITAHRVLSMKSLPPCKLQPIEDDIVQDVTPYTNDPESAIVELSSKLEDQSPYSMKQKLVNTAELVDPAVSPFASNDDSAFVPYQNDNAEACIHNYDGVKIILSLKSISSLMDPEKLKIALSLRFKNNPYFLEISECNVNGNEVFVRFTQEDGVSKVLANPPNSLLGATIEVYGISFKTNEAPQSPSFLVIEKLSLLDISDQVIQEFLISLFENNGYEVAEVVIETNAYVWFKSNDVIQSIVKNPPDNSTFLGHPVTFRAGYEAVLNGSAPEFNSGIVLVKNLPEECSQQYRPALVLYLKKALNGIAPTHCDINGSEAAVKFEDKQVALTLIQNPPKSAFISEVPTFELISRYDFSSCSGETFESFEQHNKSNKTSAILKRSQPPLPQPRTKVECSSVLFTNLPKNCKKHSLQIYLEALTQPTTCEELILQPPKAVVYFSNTIDFQNLKSTLSAEKFEGKFSLIVEPTPPLFSVLVTTQSRQQIITGYDVKNYCKKFKFTPEIDEVEKEDGKFVATFQSKKEREKFLQATASHRKIGDIDLVVTLYHPLLASLEEQDDPPPIPPRLEEEHDHAPPSPPPRPHRLRTDELRPFHFPADDEVIYGFPPVVEDVSVPLRKYLFQTLLKLNKQLLKIHAEAHVQTSSIEICPKPIIHANTVPDWEGKALKILQDHKSGFIQKDIEIEAKYVSKLIVYLQHEEQHHHHLEDFPHYVVAINGNHVQLSGSKSGIEKVETMICNFLEKEVEKSHKFKKEHYEIEYLLKFGADIFESMDPPVSYERVEAKPGVLIIKGVQRSLDIFEKAASEKLTEIRDREFFPLTRVAHRLLSSHQGKLKLAECLTDDTLYVYIPLESGGDRFSHQVCIMSPKPENISLAKRTFESLCKEDSIHIPQEKKGILSSKEWKEKLDELQNGKYFVSIRAVHSLKKNEERIWITVTGEEDDIWKVSEEIKNFLETQNESTVDISFNRPIWTVIENSAKMQEVKKRAKEQKVAHEINEEASCGSMLHLSLKGAMQSVESIKTMLLHMKNEVQQKDVTIESIPGLGNVFDKGIIDAKCKDLLKQHNDVEIQFEMVTVADDHETAANEECLQKSCPNWLFKAQSGTGVIINVYEGDYTQLGRDALVVFVSDDPSLDEALQLPHISAGGEELQSHATHLAQSTSNWVAPSVHRAKPKALRCNGLYYAVLPPYSMVDKTKAASALESVLKKVFETCTMSNYHELVFSPLTAAPLNYPYHVIANALVSSFSICGMFSSDLNISLFAWQTSLAAPESFIQVLRDQHEFSVSNKQKTASSASMSIDQMSMQSFRSRAAAMSIDQTSMQSFRGCDSKFAIVLKKSIEIVYGNLLDYKADVYVNSTNSSMNLSNGTLSNSFKKRCGQPLLDEVDEYMKKNEKLKDTVVVVTGAHGLNAKKIYHVSLPTSSKTQSGYIDIFKQTAKNIFLTAMKEGHKSIAIPCLGTANLGYSSQLSARVLLETAASFLQAHPGAISKFTFVAFRLVDQKAFNEEFEKLTNPAAATEATECSVRVIPANSAKASVRNGQLKLEVLHGDIAKETANVIVNSTSADMQRNANQISKAIFAAGGAKLKEACSRLTSSGQSLSNGKVLATIAGGKLKCNEVYHVFVPGKDTVSTPPAAGSDMQTPMTTCLNMAETDKHESISFPAFNLGAGNYTCEQSGMLMFQCIEKFIRTSPKYLKNIKVVIFNKKLCKQFSDYFRKHFSVNDATCNTVILEQMPHSLIKRRNIKFRSTPLPPKPIIQKCAAVFHVYSLKSETSALVEEKLRLFFRETFVRSKVKLDQAVEIMHNPRYLKEIYTKAQMEDVEVQKQEDTKSILLYGEKNAVQNVKHVIEKSELDCLRLTDKLQKYEWLYEDPASGDLVKYNDDMIKKLEVAYQKKSPSVDICIDDADATIDLNAMEERDTVRNTRRKVVRQQKIVIDLPNEWCPQSSEANGKEKVLEFVLIMDPSLAEYAKATDLFKKSLGTPNYLIDSVQRIQNPGEYTRFVTLKHTWQSTHTHGKVTEKEVFHGTKFVSVSPICSLGFNRSLAATANAAYLGKGAYFALNASYSAQERYSPVDDEGLQNILVCSLVVGKYTKGNEKMLIAPYLPNDNQRSYDTLVDNEANPTIFVAMKDSQVYPKYWIRFKFT